MTTTHPSSTRGESQCELILAELRKAGGSPVYMPTLVDASGSYNIHSRISDLRKQGHAIFNETRRVGGAVQSKYWLIEKREVAA